MSGESRGEPVEFALPLHTRRIVPLCCAHYRDSCDLVQVVDKASAGGVGAAMLMRIAMAVNVRKLIVLYDREDGTLAK